MSRSVRIKFLRVLISINIYSYTFNLYLCKMHFIFDTEPYSGGTMMSKDTFSCFIVFDKEHVPFCLTPRGCGHLSAHVNTNTTQLFKMKNIWNPVSQNSYKIINTFHFIWNVDHKRDKTKQKEGRMQAKQNEERMQAKQREGRMQRRLPRWVIFDTILVTHCREVCRANFYNYHC